MSQVRCKIDDLGKVVSDILEEYGEDIYKGVREAVPKVAKIAKQEVQAASPVRKKGGKAGRYKKGWAIKEEVKTQLRTDFIIHNRTDYQLTFTRKGACPEERRKNDRKGKSYRTYSTG